MSTEPIITQPSIDWEDTAPPVYPPTGCKVLWNDKQRIFDYFLQDLPDWKMKPVDYFFEADGTTLKSGVEPVYRLSLHPDYLQPVEQVLETPVTVAQAQTHPTPVSYTHLTLPTIYSV